MENWSFKPFSEEKLVNPWRKSEPWDEFVPPGFISDFVLNRRGYETPTKFCVWSALFLISSVLKREAWLEWGSGKRYTNLYVFLVSPHAINAKTTAIEFGADDILPKLTDYIKDPVMRAKKTLTILTSATPEGMFRVMNEKIKTISIPNVEKQTISQVEIGSELTMIASELATFLGRQQYNTGLIGLLTHLYDCPKVTDHATAGKGVKPLRNTYLTMLGGITPDGLNSSIPEAAFGDGFLSRVNVVTELGVMRAHPQPIKVVEPTANELAVRLAWIAENCVGSYTLSQEVKDQYYPWYINFRESLDSDENMLKRGLGRFDAHLLKVAMLIRCSKYQKGNVVEMEDYLLAKKILEDTYKESNQVMNTVGLNERGQSYNSVKMSIRRKKEITRRELLCNHSRKIDARNMTIILDQLLQEGQIVVYGDNQRSKAYVGKSGTEVYKWVDKD